MKYVLILLITLSFQGFSQQTVKGRVFESGTSTPLQNVTITDIKSKKWSITDANGFFEMELKISESVSLNFKLLGKQELNQDFQPFELNNELLIFLENQDLRLTEVVVSARKGKDYSEIVMGREVIDQVQAFSLSDVLEQLPGQAVTNFDLSEFKTIAFRTVKPSFIGNTGFGNKSFGTAIVVDGIPISNNENMQSYVGNYGDPFSPNLLGFGDATANEFNGYFSNANYGADLRQIAVENIEKVEVVQGVPSAKYGDLTSGLVKVEQRAGKSPFRIFTSLRDGTTEYGFSKGFKINEKLGFINLNIGRLESNTSPRTSFTKYDRITTNLMWSWTNKSKNIKNSFSVDYGFNDDNVNYEEEDTEHKIVKNKKKDISISNRFKWNFKKSFFDNLDVNFNFNYSDQFTYQSQFTNNGGKIVGTSLSDGVYTATYTPPGYTSVKAVEGIPISGYLAADLYKTFLTGTWSHSASFGVSTRMSDNKGRGRLGSPETMITIFGGTSGSEGQGFRPYNYGDNVRAEYQFSGYAEDNITKSWANSMLNINAGLRYDNQNSYSNLSPRINSFYIIDDFKIRGGFGLTSKTPSINQIYTGPRFFDAVLGDYRLPGYYNLGIVQTFVDFDDNRNLKPSKSMRTELGLDYRLPFGNINVTGFYNHLYNGITNESVPMARAIADLEVTFNGTSLPTYEITGYSPFFYTQNKLVNKFKSTDKGIEFFLSFEKTPLRSVSFDINGSFTETTNLDDVEGIGFSSNPDTFEKFGIYKSYEERYRQFRLGSNLNYHLSKIGLVISLRTEHFIVQRADRDASNQLVAYLDADFNRTNIPESDRALYPQFQRSNFGIVPRKEDQVYNNFHLRISKDFLNGFRFSFYANNFLDLNQTEIALENGQYVKRTKSDMVQLSFGSKIEYQF